MESSQFSDSQPRYESLEPLEVQGATCDTFRVKLFGKLHFLKRLKQEYANDIRYQEAFRKEFETGYRLEHPHLVRYISYSDNGILIEYVDGETLTQRLARQPDYFNNRKNTDKFIRQLLDVIGYLHSHQVLHLDLKPDNILLTRINDDVKLIDLGCCYTDTFTDTTGHTNSFAAPEQLSTNNCELSIQTDIYAIGKIIELLPNHHIYNKVIARCTATAKEDRYQSVEELRKACFEKSWKWPVSVMIVLMLAISLWYVLPLSQTEEGIISETIITELSSDSIIPAIPSYPTSSAHIIQAEGNRNGTNLKNSGIKWEIVESKLKYGIDSLCEITIANFRDSTVTYNWHTQHQRFDREVRLLVEQLANEYPNHQTNLYIKSAEYFKEVRDSIFHQMQRNR